MRILLPIGIALLSACSSSSDPASTPPADTGVVEDTGAVGDTATPTAKNLGYVSVRRQSSGGTTSVMINGGFFDAISAACPTVVNAGSCQYSRCPSGPVVGKARDAGVVSVVHGSDAPIELVKSTSYAKGDLAATFFAAGDTFTFSATGADVPAFSGAKVVAPADVTATLPTEIERTTDLVITWTGGTTGTVDLFLSGSLDTESESISCSAPAAGGTLTIPKELLAKLSSTSGFFDLSPTNREKVESSAWIVNLTVQALGASGAVTIH